MISVKVTTLTKHLSPALPNSVFMAKKVLVHIYFILNMESNLLRIAIAYLLININNEIQLFLHLSQAQESDDSCDKVCLFEV